MLPNLLVFTIMMINTAISLLLLFCVEQEDRRLFVLLDGDDANEIEYRYAPDRLDEDDTSEIEYRYAPNRYFHGWVRLRKGWNFTIREPHIEELDTYPRKRFTIRKKELGRLEHVMTEKEFKDFALKGIQWLGNCDQCSWGPYSEVYVVVPIKEEGKLETYQALRLASVIIDI